MSSLKHILASLLAGMLAWFALGGPATAQQTADRVTPGVQSSRSSWQQRVLRRRSARPPGNHVTAASGYRLAQQPTPARRGTQNAGPRDDQLVPEPLV